jgi:hypothetical protein
MTLGRLFRTADLLAWPKAARRFACGEVRESAMLFASNGLAGVLHLLETSPRFWGGGSVMGKVLTSWKEIAQYFGKGVRTVQRWEAAFDLPVRRAAAGRDHRAILALTDDLDEWIRSWNSHHKSDLERLREEVASLRAENLALKQKLEERTRLIPLENGLYLDDGLLIRSSRLISETVQLGEYSKYLVDWSRKMRAARNPPTIQ